MKYKVEVIVNLPRDKMIEIFDNPDNLSKWQPTFLSIESVEGVERTKGAKSSLRYKQGKGEMEMLETILVFDMPDEFSCIYEADDAELQNIRRNRRSSSRRMSK